MHAVGVFKKILIFCISKNNVIGDSLNIFDMNEGNHGILWIGLQFLIVLDIFLISLMLLLNLPAGVVSFIQTFDLIICIFL